MARDVSNPNPDVVDQFNDLVAGFGTRDHTNRPLGDVLGHAVNRLATCYALIEAAFLLGDVAEANSGGRDTMLALKPGGDPPQDRMGTTEYPAAHLSPCSLIVATGRAVKPLTRLDLAFNGGIAQARVRQVMEETELVHFIVNVADSRMEGARRKNGDGFSHALARSCTLAARDPKATPKQVFFDVLMPDYKAVAASRLHKAEQELFAKAPDALGDVPILFSANGGALNPPAQPTDFTIHAKDPKAWRANRLALRKVFETFHAAPPPPTDRLAKAASMFAGLRHNEMNHKKWMKGP
jgi:hypothetical protein